LNIIPATNKQPYLANYWVSSQKIVFADQQELIANKIEQLVEFLNRTWDTLKEGDFYAKRACFLSIK